MVNGPGWITKSVFCQKRHRLFLSILFHSFMYHTFLSKAFGILITSTDRVYAGPHIAPPLHTNLPIDLLHGGEILSLCLNPAGQIFLNSFHDVESIGARLHPI